MQARAFPPIAATAPQVDAPVRGDDEVAELWATVCSAQDPLAVLRETLVRVVAEERDRCAVVAETDADPDEPMPWRYRLRFRLRPETMTRTAIKGIRRAIAARIRGR